MVHAEMTRFIRSQDYEGPCRRKHNNGRTWQVLVIVLGLLFAISGWVFVGLNNRVDAMEGRLMLTNTRLTAEETKSEHVEKWLTRIEEKLDQVLRKIR